MTKSGLRIGAAAFIGMAFGGLAFGAAGGDHPLLRALGQRLVAMSRPHAMERPQAQRLWMEPGHRGRPHDVDQPPQVDPPPPEEVPQDDVPPPPLPDPQPAPTHAPRELSLNDYGPVGDGVTDDAPAFRRALAALQAQRGGTLVIPPVRADGMPALWRLRSQVAFDSGSGWSYASYRMVGYGANVVITTDGSPFAAFLITNANTFVIEGIHFYGWHNAPGDIAPTPAPLANVILSGGVGLVLSHVEFNGFNIDRNGGQSAVVWATSLRAERVTVAGCGGGPSLYLPFASDARLDDITFADFFSLDQLARAPNSQSGAAISIAPTADAQHSVYGTATVRLRNIRLDEGSGAIVVGSPLGPALGFVEIDGVRQNVSPNNDTVGIDLANIQHATVRHLWTREGGRGSVALRARGVHALEIAHTTTRLDSGPLYGLLVDAGSGTVRIADSHLDRSGIAQGVRVIDQDL